MNKTESERVMKNSLTGIGLAIGLFFGGLFVSLATWGLGSVVGVPMMILGLALPFWQYRQSQRGINWLGRRGGESAVKSRGELRDEVSTLRQNRTTPQERYQVI